jgi:signal transduction histidine kinase
MLLNLVNDLLDYAKFENGNFIFLNDIFNLADLIKKNSFSTLHFQAEERKIKLKY